MVRWVVNQGRATIKMACMAFGFSQTCLRYARGNGMRDIAFVINS
jgi:hypothetical protein